MVVAERAEFKANSQRVKSTFLVILMSIEISIAKSAQGCCAFSLDYPSGLWMLGGRLCIFTAKSSNQSRPESQK